VDLETRLRTVEDILRHICRSRNLNRVRQDLIDSLEEAVAGRKEAVIPEPVSKPKEETAKEKAVRAVKGLGRASTQST